MTDTAQEPEPTTTTTNTTTTTSPEMPPSSPSSVEEKGEVAAAAETEAPTLASSESAAAETKHEDDNETSAAEPKRKVTFGIIELREYSRCLGNNPATTHGPPLSLGWSYNKTGTYDVEKYEAARPPRRVTNQMLVPGSVREQILLEQSNVTKKQILSVQQEIKAARHRRQLTVAMQEFENWHIAAELVKRRFRRLRRGVSKQKEIELLWENAQKTLPKKKGGGGKAVAPTDPVEDDDSDTVSDSGFIAAAAAS